MLYLLHNKLRAWLEDHHADGLFGVLDQVHFRVLAAALVAFFIVVFLGRRVIAWLIKRKIGDTGLSDTDALAKIAGTKANTPTMGGLLIIGAIIGSTLLLADITNFYIILGFVVLIWLSILGGFDDWLKLTARTRATGSRQGLFAWEKLVFQIGLGLLVGYFLYKQGLGEKDLRHVLNIPFQKTYLGIAKAPNPGLYFLLISEFILLSILMLTGMSNAVNITDGMDGLAGGISAAVALGLAILTLIAGDMSTAQSLLVPYIPNAREVSVLAGAMGGACLGFLWWNCSPAQVFMGDTGSLSLGGLIAYIALVSRQEFVVLLMCGVFLWEIASVTMQVVYFKSTKGKRIFRCAPYHHHLHLGGWTEGQVVSRAWIVSILFVILALATIKLR
jgi:phospho-N-acetylmuramoyl-pentapeptide-transferase